MLCFHLNNHWLIIPHLLFFQDCENFALMMLRSAITHAPAVPTGSHWIPNWRKAEHLQNLHMSGSPLVHT